MPQTITADAFEDLLDDATAAQIAAAASADLTALVGDWTRVNGISFAPEPDTFTASGRAAAMQCGLILRLSDASPILRTVTVTAVTDDGRIRLDAVDITPDADTDPAPADDAPALSDEERRDAMIAKLTRARNRGLHGAVTITTADADELIALLG